MNVLIGNNNYNRAQPLVDFNYNIQNNGKRRKSMFQILSPKKNSKSLFNNNPKDIFNAANKINSILSKNLKTIIDENKNENTNDTPLFENVNCLIKKSRKSNAFLYAKFLNEQNNINNKKLFTKDSTISKGNFRKSEIIHSKNQLKSDTIVRKSIKNTLDLGKNINLTPSNKINTKLMTKQSSISSKTECRTPTSNRSKHKKEFFNFDKRKSSVYNNFKFNLKKPQVNFESETLKYKNNMRNKLFKENDKEISDNKNNTGIIILNNKSKKSIKNVLFSMDTKFGSLARKSISKGNLNKKRVSFSNFKLNNKINSKIKAPRHSVFLESPKQQMKIPTLKQINSAITNTFINQRIDKTKKELADFENNEISQIINKLPQSKTEKKRFEDLTSITSNQNLSYNLTETKDLISINTQTENMSIIEDDRYQRKYRKLYLSKNLYDSLDDEEVVDMEKIYTFYISPDSFTVYILDFFVLIASLIELYYLPLYISLYISSYSVYDNLISSFIFYIIDFIYIVDLITGFFRAYYNFEEVLIKKNVNICINYLTGWFFLDLIEAIPIFTLLDKNMRKSIKKFNGMDNMYDFGLNNKYFALTIIKVFKIFKTFTYNRLHHQIYKFTDRIIFLYEWKGLFSSIIVTFSTLHFCTCFFIFLGKNEFQGWIVKNNLQDNSFLDIYIASLYYQMTTLTTVGYGDISSTCGYEYIYGIFILIVGTCAYSWILTFISNYIKKINEKYIDFEEKMNVLREIKLEYPNIGESLYDRIKRYLNYNKNEFKYNLKFILESLPSSLQNNLIIEIYKPIIKNFQFFKSFENSNFFVKIVTSLKPILSMKDDILIQEGDIIEDIIFIKNGVLSLEIIIDLDDIKKSAESHLEMTGMDCFKSISNKKLTELMNANTMYANYRPEFGKQIYNNKYKKKKEIKIIDLRKNEHFGDILMILNEKSPVAVKVKSKKAELFFLQKTEATEISNKYSNIWKRIVNRSLHNMKQIKNLIRKKIFLYTETNNIEIDQEIKERYIMERNITSDNNTTILEVINNLKNSNIINTIIEEEESVLNKSQTVDSEKNINLNNQEQEQIQDNKMKDNFEKTDKQEKKLKKNKTKEISVNFMLKGVSSDNKEKKNSQINQNINGVNDMINIIDKEVKKSSKKNQINNFNINIYTPKVQFPISQLNIENQNSSRVNLKEKEEKNDSYVMKGINSEISFSKEFEMDIKDNNILMNNLDENNKIFYYNQNNKENKDNRNTNITDDYNSNIEKLLGKGRYEKIKSKKQNEIVEIKTDDKISIKSISSDKSKIDKKKEEISQINKINHFSNLNTSQSTSFSINSSYDNINQISKYNFQRNADLREKTKNFILEQIDKETKPKIPQNNNTKHNNFLSIKYNMNLKRNNSIMRKKSENLEKTITLYNKDDDNKSHNKRSTLQCDENNIIISKSAKKIQKNEDIIKDFDLKPKESKNSFSVINVNNDKNFAKKKQIKKYESTDEKEKTFYNKINRKKTIKKRRTIEEKPDNEENNDEVNFDKLISKNIENNQQNLNNPEEYFEGFFNDIISKKKQGNKITGEKGVKKKITLDV